MSGATGARGVFPARASGRRRGRSFSENGLRRANGLRQAEVARLRKSWQRKIFQESDPDFCQDEGFNQAMTLAKGKERIPRGSVRSKGRTGWNASQPHPAEMRGRKMEIEQKEERETK